jgi:hypothetical protein
MHIYIYTMLMIELIMNWLNWLIVQFLWICKGCETLLKQGSGISRWSSFKYHNYSL